MVSRDTSSHLSFQYTHPRNKEMYNIVMSYDIDDKATAVDNVYPFAYRLHIDGHPDCKVDVYKPKNSIHWRIDDVEQNSLTTELEVITQALTVLCASLGDEFSEENKKESARKGTVRHIKQLVESI